MTLKHPTYAIHPSVPYQQAIVANMAEKTGKSLDEWLSELEQQKIAELKPALAWLKQHGKLGATTAGIIAKTLVNGKADHQPDAYLAKAPQLVEAMYSGKKASLVPIHNALIELVQDLGMVKISPCKTIVPCYRNHVFAEIKPATQKRVDLGLALKGCNLEIPPQVVDTGGLAKGDRITHRIPLTSPEQVGSNVEKWLKIAWNLDAGSLI